MLPFSTEGFGWSLVYITGIFYLFRKYQTKAILQDHRGGQESEAAAWFLEKSLTTMVTGEHIYGPFPLGHLDLHYNNILIDGGYNTIGILDWSNTQTVPIERFALIPEFILPPAASKQAITELRGMFVDTLEKVERERERSPSEKGLPLHHLFASPLSEIVRRCTHSYP